MEGAMKKLLSVPENLVSVLHDLEGLDPHEWYVDSDPPGSKVGSGGGTAHLLAGDWRRSGRSGRRVVIHAGGQSRRLPSYAPSGKLLTPVPVFRWSRGQRIDQNLLDLQLPLYDRLMADVGPEQNTLIASGDVLILAPQIPRDLPQADVVCFGIWVDPQLASRHGVFFTPRHDPRRLQFMLQKPSHGEIEALSATSLYQMDVGLWILSDRAVDVLMRKSGWDGQRFERGTPDFYDLYAAFGPALGAEPTSPDPLVSPLSVAVVPLEGGGFHHFGTSLELITSMGAVQNLVQDQRFLWHHRVKPHPTLFTQNAVTDIAWTERHHHIWIENSCIPSTWSLADHHVLTGIPENDWHLVLPPGLCLDIVPVGEEQDCVRPYGMGDRFSGNPADAATLWMGRPVVEWLEQRGLSLRQAGLTGVDDVQKAPLFPLLDAADLNGEWVTWLIAGGSDPARAAQWCNGPRLSAEQISVQANLTRLYRQRDALRLRTLPLLALNAQRSVFYQVDLLALAGDFVRGRLPLPPELPAEAPVLTQARDAMFRAEVARGAGGDSSAHRARAFEALRTGLIGSAPLKAHPLLDVFADQIVWARSPARLDLAGGWSDTPPYCIQTGGRVVNLAVDLNGQPPLQVFVRLSSRPTIVLRSIDNGVGEEVTTYEELAAPAKHGSAFSIPRAALTLAGFHPRFSVAEHKTLKDQLQAFGGGIEISLLAAIPQGSGLGTSSILAATVLGALSDFCRLRWTREEVCHRTLVLEQLLTTGGGWQDQFGGVLPGVKILETEPGWQDKVGVRWLPDLVFTGSDTREHWLLYYTGITRSAKTILAEIVTGMFLNEGPRLAIVDDIKAHAVAAADALHRCDLAETGRVIGQSWRLNKALDPGTTSPEIEALVGRVSDWSLGHKLLGAGGGGYLLLCAKDPEAARRIQDELTRHPPNAKARFVKMSLSTEGFQLTRS
jgi:galactokinase/mevalonate kinase-like predicted kinase